jgi:hypothetical protein
LNIFFQCPGFLKARIGDEKEASPGCQSNKLQREKKRTQRGYQLEPHPGQHQEIDNMRILHGVVLALAFSADGACAWIASSAVVGQGVAKGMVERRRGGLSLCMKAKPSPGGGEESQRTRREAIALGGAAAAGSLAQPASAAEKKKRKMQPVVITDKEMTEVKAGKWLERHKPGTRDLVVGLEGEPYFLLSGKDGVEPYALRCVFVLFVLCFCVSCCLAFQMR